MMIIIIYDRKGRSINNVVIVLRKGCIMHIGKRVKISRKPYLNSKFDSVSMMMMMLTVYVGRVSGLTKGVDGAGRGGRCAWK